MKNENKNYLTEYLEGYKNIINLNYLHIEKHHKETFPLLRYEKYLDYCVCTFNEKQFNNKFALLIVDNYVFDKKELDFRSIDPELFSKVVDYETDQRIEKFLAINFPLLVNKNIFIVETFSLNIYAEIRGERKANKDYIKWKTENKTSVDSYNHEQISPYSHLDYEGLIKKFNIDEFKEDFKYQMDQAEECYKRKLYLPAAATLSIALETVLLSICKKENIKLDNDTMLNYLGEQLLNKKIINYRLSKRIDVTYSLRNSLSHTNNGEVSKADCEIILNCIRTVLDSYF